MLRPRRSALLVGLALILSLLSLGTLARRPAAAETTYPYADPAFQATRDELDRPLDAGVASRTWFWGPGPISEGLQEPYAESPGGSRLTQYFDKGRVEITQPGADVSQTWHVSSGLLTRELISGQAQVGDSALQPIGPANIPLAGDPDNAWPTYASFADIIDHGSADQTNGDHYATNALLPDGVTSYAPAASDPNAQYVHYIAYTGPFGPTGYNVPRAFWDFMMTGGVVWDGSDFTQRQPLMDWLYVLGYPLSDPFWANVRVDGELTWVLTQPFERRVLTYTPSNPAGWRVEMGNIGRHYLTWRYQGNPPEPGPAPNPSPAPSPSPTPVPQPVQPAGDFFAMQVGDSWIYQDHASGAVYTVAITGVSDAFNDGRSLMAREETRPDGSVERSFWDTHETVLWLAGFELYDADGALVDRVEYDPELRYIGMDLEPGAGWGTDAFPLGSDDTTLRLYAFQVDGVGPVSVPSGIYTASLITESVTATDGQHLVGPTTLARQFYFTPRVGIVRDIRADGSVLDLVSADLR